MASEGSSTASSRSSKPVDCVRAKFDQFVEERKEEAVRLFHRVLHIGTLVGGTGMVFSLISLVIGVLSGHDNIVSLICFVIGALCKAAGTVLVSTCPPDSLDINIFIRSRPRLRMGIGACYAIGEVFVGISLKPHANLLVMPLALLAGVERGTQFINTRATTLIVMIMAMDLFGLGLADVWCFVHDESQDGFHTQLPQVGWVVLAGVRFCAIALLVCRWVYSWWSQRRTRGTRGVNPTQAVYEAIYVVLVSLGVYYWALGAMDLISGKQTEVSVSIIVSGVAFAFPALMVIAFGPQRVFYFFQRRFDRNAKRAFRDGAFVATLLESASVNLGDSWWVLRANDDKDSAYPPEDKRHHWRRGRVVRLDNASLDVEFPAGVAPRVSTFPATSRSASCEVIISDALRSLRCVDWKDLSRQLLGSGAMCGSADNMLQANRYYALSRPLLNGEVIDFFLSHSWHDDPDAKYSALERVVQKFIIKHGRPPTFWFDKTCIDQQQLAEGLRVLPVHVMACRRMLVLCGDTYLTRMWCVWEIFTLMAVVHAEQVFERFVVVPLHGDTRGQNPLANLIAFDIREAACFNPNDEARIRVIVDAIGADSFNARIRELGRLCRVRGGRVSVRESV